MAFRPLSLVQERYREILHRNRRVTRGVNECLDTENRLLAALTPTQRAALADTLRRLLESLGDTAAP